MYWFEISHLLNCNIISAWKKHYLLGTKHKIYCQVHGHEYDTYLGKFNIINMIIIIVHSLVYLTLLLACTKQVIRCENRHRYTQDPADRMEKCRQITGVTNVCFHTDYVTLYDRSSVYVPRFTLQIIIYHYLSLLVRTQVLQVQFPPYCGVLVGIWTDGTTLFG